MGVEIGVVDGRSVGRGKLVKKEGCKTSNMNLTENYSRKMSEILGRKMSEILGWKISQKVPKVRIFPIKISSMENVRNLFVGKCHGKDDISENVRNFRWENVRNFEVRK